METLTLSDARIDRDKLAEQAKRSIQAAERPMRVIDPAEKRWQHNTLVEGEGPAVPGYNATATPLDAYRHTKVISEREYQAGNSLREIWTQAGRDPKLVVPFDERTDPAGEDMSFSQSNAWAKFRRVMFSLSNLHQAVVYEVCCIGNSAENWAARKHFHRRMGLVLLRDGLDVLAKNI